ncbi:MAG: PA4642 family protein [Moraxellaceae bacterium]|nr:PA4642 family protein [Moraxellaceae bacterium]
MSVSQPARFGEDWSDERIAGYLDRLPPAGDDADFNVLYTAYKHMRLDDFQRFLQAFTQQGRNINGKNSHGKTMLTLVGEHAQSQGFVDALVAHGAQH